MNLDAHLAQLENAQLVRRLSEEELAYLFKHALTQETVYQSLLLKARREIHRRVAEAYEQIYPERLAESAALLARHYAEAGDDARTMEYSIKAAEAAARLSAYPEARVHYARALDALTRLPDTEAHRRVRVDTILPYVELAWGATLPEENFDLLAEAETLARSLPGPDGTLGESRHLAQIRAMKLAFHIARGEFREAVPQLYQALEHAKVLREPALVATHSAELGNVLVCQGRFADAVPFLLQAMTLMEGTPDRWEWFYAVECFGLSLAMRGQVAAGLTEVQRALTRMEGSNNYLGIVTSRVFLLMVYYVSGEMARLLEESQPAIEFAITSGHPLFVSIGLGYQALALSRLGEHAKARASMAASRAAGTRVGGQHMMSDWLAAARAEIAHNAGELEDSLSLADQAVAVAQTMDSVFAEGWAERVWGQALARREPPPWNEVEAHLAASLRLFEAGGAVLEAARTHVVWGKFLAQRGDVSAAREHLAKAAAQFEASEMRRESDETRDIIAALPSGAA